MMTGGLKDELKGGLMGVLRGWLMCLLEGRLAGRLLGHMIGHLTRCRMCCLKGQMIKRSRFGESSPFAT